MRLHCWWQWFYQPKEPTPQAMAAMPVEDIYLQDEHGWTDADRILDAALRGFSEKE